MRKSFALLLAAGVGVVLGRMLDGVSSTAEARGGMGGGVAKCAEETGDVNADGMIDLSDAVTILGHLFLGSPTALAPPCAPPAAPSGLPPTGQTTCYGFTGSVIDCTSSNCTGQDGSYAAGCAPEGRFVDNGDGTVTDNCTGLMWQKDLADVNGDGQLPVSDGDFSDSLAWCDALAYCESLSFAGHDDWRLPNVQELHSIMDYGRAEAPLLDPVFGELAFTCWSSTSYEESPGLAWDVFFKGGITVRVAAKSIPIRVRAVRSGP